MDYRLVFICFLFLTACGGSNEAIEDQAPIVTPINNSLISTYKSSSLPIPDNSDVSHFEILFIGNSHTSSHNLPQMVELLIERSFSDKTVNSEKVNSSSFLAERINDGMTRETIASNNWTHVILQAQKLSSSQSYYYPTEAAETWVEVVKKEASATPILFAEHPQRGNSTEAQYIHNIYQGIADKKPACVSPIGLAWDKAILIYPELTLHATDGNHASLTGTFLTALVLVQTITNQSVENFEYLEAISITQNVQSQLAQVAAQTIAETPACPHF